MAVYNPDFEASPPEDDETDTTAPDIDAQLSAMPGIGSMYQSILAGRQKRQAQNTADTAQMWQNYKDQMTQERVGPTKLERIASALTAFGAAPTRKGNFFEALNAANKNMLETGAEASAADRARKKALSELSFKQSQSMATQRETGASEIEDLQMQALKTAATAGDKDVVVVGDNLVDRKTGKVVYTGAAKAAPPSSDRFLAEALAAVNSGKATPLQRKLVTAFLQGKSRPSSVMVTSSGLPAGYTPE